MTRSMTAPPQGSLAVSNLCGPLRSPRSNGREVEPRRSQRSAEEVEMMPISSSMALTHPNDTSGQVVDAAMKVHSALGPGLLESAYEACLGHELRKRGLGVQVQLPLPITYDGVRIDIGYRVDLLIDNAVVVEVKAVAK